MSSLVLGELSLEVSAVLRDDLLGVLAALIAKKMLTIVKKTIAVESKAIRVILRLVLIVFFGAKVSGRRTTSESFDAVVLYSSEFSERSCSDTALVDVSSGAFDVDRFESADAFRELSIVATWLFGGSVRVVDRELAGAVVVVVTLVTTNSTGELFGEFVEVVSEAFVGVGSIISPDQASPAGSAGF